MNDALTASTSRATGLSTVTLTMNMNLTGDQVEETSILVALNGGRDDERIRGN